MGTENPHLPPQNLDTHFLKNNWEEVGGLQNLLESRIFALLSSDKAKLKQTSNFVSIKGRRRI